MYKKICLILFVLIIITIPCYAGGLGANFKVPDEFKQVDINDNGDWDGESPILVYDKYELKTDSNIYITVEEYDKEIWDEYTTTDASTFDFCYDLDNNMVVANHMDKDELSYGSVLEVVELNGNMYMVDLTFWGVPLNTDDQVKNATNYLDEFNKLNNVKPIQI